MFQLEKSLSNPDHPYCHFGTGSLETLYDEPKAKGQDIRAELLKFHDNYYSANIMKLCILGRGKLSSFSYNNYYTCDIFFFIWATTATTTKFSL